MWTYITLISILLPLCLFSPDVFSPFLVPPEAIPPSPEKHPPAIVAASEILASPISVEASPPIVEERPAVAAAAPEVPAIATPVEVSPPVVEERPAVVAAAPKVPAIATPVEASPPIVEERPAIVAAAPEVPAIATPVEASPPIVEERPAVVAAAPKVPAIATPVEASPPIVEERPAVVSAAPEVPAIATPVEVSPPVVEERPAVVAAAPEVPAIPTPVEVSPPVVEERPAVVAAAPEVSVAEASVEASLPVLEDLPPATIDALEALAQKLFFSRRIAAAKANASKPAKKAPGPKADKIAYPIPKRLTLSHNTGYGRNSGVGQGSNYTTFGVFMAPDYVVGAFYPLIDLRANRFDNDSYAFNVGVGARYIPAPNTFCEILGFNVDYDWRQGCLNEYNQLGVGLEVLGKRWDFRANGYFPVGAKTYQVTCRYEYEGGYEITHRRKEITTYGFNAEVGWLAISSKNFLLYTAAGPYYLTRNSCDFKPIRGGKVRIRPQYKDYIALDASYSYDSNFNSIWELTFFVTLPLYQISNQNERPCRLTDRQIYQPIERFEIMPLGKRSCWKTNF